MSPRHLFIVAVLTVAEASASPVVAQQTTTAPTDAEAALRAADAGYWRAYNACDAAGMSAYIADDVEFYHDKGGLTRTKQALVDSTMKGICGNPNFRIRRVADANIRFDPIPGYGGVLSGDHLFFATEPGMPERQTGRATFVALWHVDQGHWTMTRVLSLSHRPVPYVAPAAGTVLSAAQLERYVGDYRMPTAGIATVAIENGKLTVSTGMTRLTLAAKSPDHFFAIERPLQFDFSGNAKGKTDAVTVIEEGKLVDRGVRSDPANP